MKSFLYDTYIEVFKDGFFGVILGLLIWVISGILIGLVAYGVFYVADTSNVKVNTIEAVIVNKSFTPAHTTTIFVMSGKVMVPITNYYPDSWDVDFQSDIGCDSIGVTHTFYNSVRHGMYFEVEYKSGRFSDNFYITKILKQINNP